MEQRSAIRCAIYTRKSSDEGLQQAFNSLHAQREACEAYVRSQAHEGWRLLPERYDDGGYSGASADRPALRRLMADVTARRLDAVVIYKIDRLTRSLLDFARVMEAFEEAQVSVVSITQAFDTRTSMGRLTLNMLLSFAQFEREITCERIRDKIASSKAKGMWMGGALPLGYDAPTDARRALVVNPEEAKTVRLIFRRFLEFGSFHGLQIWLREEGVRSKRRLRADGRQAGGLNFSRGALRHLLANRIYLGEISHKGASHPGRHEPIVDRRLFEAVQACLEAARRERRTRMTQAQLCLLNGLVFDADGQPMKPLLARRAVRGSQRRYQYYVSARLPGASEDEDAISRVPTWALDTIVVDRLSRLFGSAAGERSTIRSWLARVEVHSASLHLLVRSPALPGQPSTPKLLARLRAQLSPGEQVLSEITHAGLARIRLPVRLVVRGGRCWLTNPEGRTREVGASIDRELIKWLRDAHASLREMGIEFGASTERPPGTERVAKSWRRQMALAFLAPDIQTAIVRGELGLTPTLAAMMEDVPLSWAIQRARLGLSSAKTPQAAWTVTS